MKVKSKVEPIDIKRSIQDTFKRSAASEGVFINVEVSGNEVTLSGKVHSLFEREDARTVAWSAPSVAESKTT